MASAGSARGLVIEYGAKVKGFVSIGARRRALQLVGSETEVEITILGFSGTERPIRLGVTVRLEVVDAPSHAANLERYRARGYPNDRQPDRGRHGPCSSRTCRR